MAAARRRSGEEYSARMSGGSRSSSGTVLGQEGDPVRDDGNETGGLDGAGQVEVGGFR